MSSPSFLILLGRYALGLAFVVASVSKLLDPVEFALSVHRYAILPEALVLPTANLLPWLELIAGVCLLFVRRYREAAAVVMLTLLLGFTAALIVAKLRGLDAPCGCFGGFWKQLQTTESSIVRNAVLIGIAVLVFVDSANAEARSRPAPG